MRKGYLSAFKSLNAKEKARPLSAMRAPHKSIHIIVKRRPAVRHTFKGLIITELIHTKLINPLKVCPTKRLLLKLIASKKGA